MVVGYVLLLYFNNCVGFVCLVKNGFYKSKFMWEVWWELFELLLLDLNYLLGGWNYRIIMVYV